MKETLQLLILLAIVAVLSFMLASCGDDLPSRKQECAASCESRGGEFYLMDGEYCYCSFTESDGGVDK